MLWSAAERERGEATLCYWRSEGAGRGRDALCGEHARARRAAVRAAQLGLRARARAHPRRGPVARLVRVGVELLGAAVRVVRVGLERVDLLADLVVTAQLLQSGRLSTGGRGAQQRAGARYGG